MSHRIPLPLTDDSGGEPNSDKDRQSPEAEHRAFSCVLIAVDNTEPCTGTAGAYQPCVELLTQLVEGLLEPQERIAPWRAEGVAVVHFASTETDGWLWGKRFAERVRAAAVEKAKQIDKESPSLSCGVAVAGPTEPQWDALDRAEHALELARREGGGKVCTWAEVERAEVQHIERGTSH